MEMLEIKDLHVSANGKEILRVINLKIEQGKVTALMGPNGSGKSTLSNVIMGNPKYEITKGQILFNGSDIQNLKPNERAHLGIFMSFQYPQEIPGVRLSNFLRTVLNSYRDKNDKLSVVDFHNILNEKLKLLKMDKGFAAKWFSGFSGGEKKRAEVLQMAMLNPKLAILDETDSGLDIDALKAVAEGVNSIMTKDKAILIITHYKRILDYIKPDQLYVMHDGKIVKSGTGDLVDKLEQEGYSWIANENEN